MHTGSRAESVVVAQARGPKGGLIVMLDGFMNVHRAQITSLADRYCLPAIYPFRFLAELNGLLCYGNDQKDQIRLAATYVGRVLRGGNPSDLPVQALVKFKLVINSRPLRRSVSKCRRRDEVIE